MVIGSASGSDLASSDSHESRPVSRRPAQQGVGCHCGLLRARILYMTTISLATARAQLSKLVEEAVSTHQRVEITRNGTRAAVLLAAEDYDSLIETIDVLSDAELVADIDEGLAAPLSDTVSVADLAPPTRHAS